MYSTLTRVVLPIVLFVALIGGITWMVQFMPHGGQGQPPVPPPPPPNAGKPVLQFSRQDRVIPGVKAVWLREEKFDEANGAVIERDSDYSLEYEKGKEGSCYFTFRNVLGAPAEFGFGQSDCDCSHAEVCLLNAAEWEQVEALLNKTPWEIPTFKNEPAWTKLTAKEPGPVKVPADGRGVLRVVWNGRKPAGESLKLHLQFYSQPEGDKLGKQPNFVYVPVVMATPLSFAPSQPSLGVLGPGETRSAEIHCWSATRDDPDVSFKSPNSSTGEPDPLFHVEAKRLSAAEAKEFQKKIYELQNKGKKENERGPLRHRVKAAWLLKVTVHEQKDGKQLELGHFHRQIPVLLDQISLESNGPGVEGQVRGDVDVGGLEDQGKVNLRSFEVDTGKSLTVPVHANPKLVLETHRQTPAVLKVELKRNAKASTAQRAQWDLKVTVPPNAWFGGPLPIDAAIELRSVGPPERLIRIPVIGNATR